MLTGNKGEWSEIYTFLRLLSDGVVYSADEELHKITTMYFPIIKIIRAEVLKEKFEYYTGKDIKIFYNDRLIRTVSSLELGNEADKVLEAIRRNKGAFSIEGSEAFMSSIYVNKLATPSQDKSDIQLQLHDINTGFEKVVGFSIKSELGNSPTLLNASKTTNFTFRIDGLNEEHILAVNSINTKQKVKDRMAKILINANALEFIEADNAVFSQNLMMIDTIMPKMIAELLKDYYITNTSDSSKLIERLANRNPFNQTLSFYKYKMKEFLCAVALGMTPAKAWNGSDEATGGYIIVKKDGDVLAYHIYNRDSFKEYLIRNTRFETASTGRHCFGLVYHEEQKTYIKLNLQIRFTDHE